MLESKHRLEVEKRQAIVADDSAFTTNEPLNLQTQGFLRYNDPQAPFQQISIEAYAKDIAGMWRQHERALWLITGICLLYLAMKLFGA